MKIRNMTAVLIWLVKFMQEKRANNLKALKEANPLWGDLDSFCHIDAWIRFHVNTKSKVTLRIEEILRQLKLISHKECGDSSELRKSALREIAGLMGIKEYNHKISKNDLERKISRFAKASA